MDLNSYSAALWMGMIGANNLVNDLILQTEAGATTTHLNILKGDDIYASSAVLVCVSHTGGCGG